MRRAILPLFLCLPLVLNAQSDKQKPKAAPPAADKAATATVTAAMLKTLSARAIGPAVMGGRISEIAYDPENPWTFYVAATHGGLLKTTDNGAWFTSLTEKEIGRAHV